MLETKTTMEKGCEREEDKAAFPIALTTTSEANLSVSQVTTIIPKQSTVPPLSEGRKNVWKWLGKSFRVKITDGRVLIGFFCCTDKDANVVLSMCSEYLEEGKDARMLGNVMIPGKHIVSIAVDMPPEDANIEERKSIEAP